MAKKKISRYRIDLERQFDSEDFHRKTTETVYIDARSPGEARKKARLLVQKKTEHRHDYDIIYSVKSITKL